MDRPKRKNRGFLTHNELASQCSSRKLAGLPATRIASGGISAEESQRAFPAVGRDVAEKVSGDRQRIDALGFHVPHKIDEVPAVGFERVLRLEHIAHPRHQGMRRTVPIGRSGHGLGKEGLHLGGKGFLSLEELAAFEYERQRAGQGRRSYWLGRQRDG
jgi:hypothetical protein